MADLTDFVNARGFVRRRRQVLKAIEHNASRALSGAVPSAAGSAAQRAPRPPGYGSRGTQPRRPVLLAHGNIRQGAQKTCIHPRRRAQEQIRPPKKMNGLLRNW